MTDQNQALPAQGRDPKKQGEQASNTNNQTMESPLNEQELNIDLPQAGEIRKGHIASIGTSQILVSIGAKSEGVVSGRERDQLTAEEREALKVGQEVHVFVVNAEDANGNVVLSLKRAQEQLSWENVDKLLANDEVIESKIIGFNKGGLIGPDRSSSSRSNALVRPLSDPIEHRSLAPRLLGFARFVGTSYCGLSRNTLHFRWADGYIPYADLASPASTDTVCRRILKVDSRGSLGLSHRVLFGGCFRWRLVFAVWASIWSIRRICPRSAPQPICVCNQPRAVHGERLRVLAIMQTETTSGGNTKTTYTATSFERIDQPV